MLVNGKRAMASSALICALATPCAAYYEGMIPHTYADPVAIPTACYGHTGPDVQPGNTYTADDCNRLLTGDLGSALRDVDRCIAIDVSPPQAAALVSFTFNVGGQALCGSTLALLANEGTPATVWCAQMLRWTHATKLGVTIELPGLVKRRNAEYRMCLGQPWQQT